MKRTLVFSLTLALTAALAAAAPPPISQLLRSVPASARAVVAVDTAALRQVPRVQEWLIRHQAWTGAGDDMRQFLADAGLDPARDVDAMLVAVLEGNPGTGVVAWFAGRYDPSSLGPALVKRGAGALTIGAVPAYRLPSEGHGDGRSVILAQPSPDLVVVGDEASLRAALEPPHAVIPLVEKEIAGGHIDLRAPFWAVATIPASLRSRAGEAAGSAAAHGGESVRSVVFASGAVERVAMEAFLDESLRISAVAVADTPENAELLRDAVKGAIAAVRLQAQGQEPELVNVLRDVQVRLSGTEVSAAGSVPVALLEKLLADHHGRHEPTR